MTAIQPRTSVVQIFQGDYLDRIRHLEQQYEAALKADESSTRLLYESSDSVALGEQHAALVAEAENSSLNVTVKALGRKAWRALVAQHPPREDSKTDALVGVNEETFKDALIAASIVSPELSEDDLDSLSDIDNDRIYYAAFRLNRAPADSPKVLVSPTSPESGAI